MKIVATTALILGLASSAFAMTPIADLNLFSGSDSDQRLEAAAQNTTLNATSYDYSFDLANGSDNDQRHVSETAAGHLNAGVPFIALFDGSDADQRRALAN